MAAVNRIGNSLRCTGCQRWLLSAFIPELAPRTTPLRKQDPQRHPKRALHTARSLRSQQSVGQENDDAWVSGETALPTASDEADPTVPDGYDATSDKPWYLQVQEAQFDQPSSIKARQQLPPLPSDPPPALEGMLEHLSVDIGLDYLSLVDLRNVDPPPALGSNLIMIFGTARSEKHLNVSADRFCRWLRTEHKLTPYADGLLGRNELKLKMRRKLRRTKMLSAAGARDMSDPDDGISTGWVCVNVGNVNETEVAEEELGNGAIGFGRRSNGTSLVVQMMTEDKRGELDLEGLWTGVRKGSIRRQEEISQAQSSPQLEAAPRSDQSQARSTESARLLSQTPPPLAQYQHDQLPTFSRGNKAGKYPGKYEVEQMEQMEHELSRVKLEDNGEAALAAARALRLAEYNSHSEKRRWTET